MSQSNQPLPSQTSSPRIRFNPLDHDFVTPTISFFKRSYITPIIIGLGIAVGLYESRKDSLYLVPQPQSSQKKLEISALEKEFEQNIYTVIQLNDKKTAFHEFTQKSISQLEKELTAIVQEGSTKEQEKIQTEYTENLTKQKKFYDERINTTTQKAKIAWGWEKPVEKDLPASMPKIEMQDNVNQMIQQYKKIQEQTQ